MGLEDRDLLSSSDVELQYSGDSTVVVAAAAGPGVAFPSPAVTTGISGGKDAKGRVYEKGRGEAEAPLEKRADATMEIGVTTTLEQYYR